MSGLKNFNRIKWMEDRAKNIGPQFLIGFNNPHMITIWNVHKTVRFNIIQYPLIHYESLCYFFISLYYYRYFYPVVPYEKSVYKTVNFYEKFTIALSNMIYITLYFYGVYWRFMDITMEKVLLIT